MQDDASDIETRWTDDQVWLPELLDVSETCCVRVCDQPAVRCSVFPAVPVPGERFEVYPLCDQHASRGWG